MTNYEQLKIERRLSEKEGWEMKFESENLSRQKYKCKEKQFQSPDKS